MERKHRYNGVPKTTPACFHSCRRKVFNSFLKHSWQVVGFEPTILWRLTLGLLVILWTKEAPNPFKHLVPPPFSSACGHRSSVQPDRLVFTPHPSLFILFSTCLVLSSIKSSHAPRGPTGPLNACGTLRGNGPFKVGEEPLGERGSRWRSTRVTCPGESVCLVLPLSNPEVWAETRRGSVTNCVPSFIVDV